MSSTEKVTYLKKDQERRPAVGEAVRANRANADGNGGNGSITVTPFMPPKKE